MRPLRTKLLYNNLVTLLIAFSLLGLIGTYGLNHMAEFFISSNLDRAKTAQSKLNSAFESNIENIRSIYQAELQNKGWTILLKDSWTLLPMFEENSFGQLRNFLAGNFRDDPEILFAAFMVREGRSLRAWQVLTKEHPSGVGMPIEFDVGAGGWRAVERRTPILIRDEEAGALSRLTHPRVQTLRIKSFDPRSDREFVAYDCVIPVMGRGTEPDAIERAHRKGQPVGYLRYVLSFDRMEGMIQQEREKYRKNLMSLERENQQAADLAQAEAKDLLTRIFALLALGALGTLVVSYVLSFISSRRVTQPVNELTRVAGAQYLS